MLEKFDTTCTTASTLGNANWNGEIGDIRESIRRVNELVEKRCGKDLDKPTTDRIVFERSAFEVIESHLTSAGPDGKPMEKFYGIPFEIIDGDTPAMHDALAKSCLGETVMLVTKGEVGLCVRSYSKPSDTPPPYQLREVSYNGGLGSCIVPIPYSPFTDRDEPIRFNPKWGQ